VDWYLPEGALEALPLLRRDLVAYLRRHGESDSNFDAAELLVAESVGNAVRHTAGPVWVSLTWRGTNPTMSVYDVGPGTNQIPDEEPSGRLALGPRMNSADRRAELAEDSGPGPDSVDPEALSESGRGLFIVRELAPRLESRERTGEGLVVSMTLPVSRLATVDHDPPRRGSAALPMLEESLPGGGFGKEAFLRALVVQLAQTIEVQHGQDSADAAVAQVGTDVGGQMEEEFRLAMAITGRMTPEQIGRCYVRLKHAIDGGFRVLEATPERIVLVNDRCPFGTAVQQAPSLCRMTSSVFGGIAARNSDRGASVLLEERIAVGDPGCRVIVDLNVPATAAAPEAHHYASPLS
jgi:anti-sigma regulatory factor (Ser/Thr protein kinase)